MATEAESPERTAFDEQFALAEIGELRTMVRSYFDNIAATERFAVAGAAAVAAFSVSGATDGVDTARPLITGIPFVILALAGLRCLTIYWVLVVALDHVKRIEEAMLANPALGFQRQHAARPGRVNRSIEAVSTLFWVLGCGAAAAFWWFANP